MARISDADARDVLPWVYVSRRDPGLVRPFGMAVAGRLQVGAS